MPEHAGRRGDVRTAVADGGGSRGEWGAGGVAAVGDFVRNHGPISRNSILFGLIRFELV